MSGENETQASITNAQVEPVTSTIEPVPSDNGQEPGPTFSQAEVDRLLGERAKRERAKFADYNELKEAKTKLDEIETARLSELEQAQKLASDAQAKADEALQTSQSRLIRAEFTAAAAAAGAKHPRDAFALADRSAVALDDAGNVTGVEEAVAALVEQGRLVMLGKPVPPKLDGGAGDGERPSASTIKLSVEQEQTARDFGVTPEEYAANIKEE